MNVIAPDSFYDASTVVAAWEKLRGVLPQTPSLFLPVDTTTEAPAAASVYPDGLSHLQIGGGQISGVNLAHEFGHCFQWAVQIARYPKDRVWSSTNAVWTDPTNSIYVEYATWRPVAGSIASHLTGDHANLIYEMFADTIARLLTGFALENEAGWPWPGDDAVLAFLHGLLPAPAPQPVPPPPPAPVPPAPPPPVTPPAPPPPSATLAGADVSNHQGTIDFDALATAVQFVLIKVTEGLSFVDPFFTRNWSEARRVGLVRGAYHFAHPELNDPIAEANYFCDHVAFEPGDLAVLDWETHIPVGFDIDAWCNAFMSQVRARTSVTSGLYLNQSEATGYAWARTVASGFWLWLADYTTTIPVTPWSVIAIQQTTSSGSLPGISGNVDLDTFFGTRDQLAKYGKQEDTMTMTDEQVLQAVERAVVARLAGTPNADPAFSLSNTVAAVKGQETKEVVALRAAAQTLMDGLK